MKMARCPIGADNMVSYALVHVVMIVLVVIGEEEYLHEFEAEP
jgi:hypothetical protein